MKKSESNNKTYIVYCWIYLIVFIIMNIIIKIFNILSIDDPIVINIVMLWIPNMVLLLYEGVKLTTFYDCNEYDEYIIYFKKKCSLMFYPKEKISNSELKKIVIEIRQLVKYAIAAALSIMALELLWTI